jgi:pyruvate/2-oxoglutarate dehydrogenase complex dihydrolipoamide acyltransferase (E2) component
MHFFTYLSINCGYDLKFVGARADQFGHVVLSNVGTLGLRGAFAPLCPPMRSTMMICTGKVRNEPAVAEDGKTFIVQKQMQIVITGDHRYADAAGYLCFYKCFDGYMNDPAKFNPSDYKEAVPFDEMPKKTE